MKKHFKLPPWMEYTLTIVVALAALAAMIFVGVSYAEKHLNASAQHAVISLGSAATGQTVSLDDININLLAGKVHIAGLKVPNEPKAKGADAFAIGTAEVMISPFSLLWGPLHIKSIKIDSPSIVGDLTSPNPSSFTLAVIATAVAAYAVTADKSQNGGQKLIVDELTLSNVNLTVYSFYPANKANKLPFSNMTLKNMGSTAKPMTQADFVNKVMSQVVNQATSSIKKLF